MKEDKFRINPFRLMMMVGQKVWDMRKLDDEYFFEDRYRWIMHTYDDYQDLYKSDSQKNKHKVLVSSGEDIAYLIHQVLRFGRILLATEKGVIYNFPRGEMPNFYLNDIKQNTLKENLEIFDYEDPLYR